MAKFRDSAVDAATVVEADLRAREASASANAAQADDGPEVHDRSIGDILAELRNLTAEQVQQVLQYQQDQGVRFGEAAVALGMASKDDVLFALSRQFHYPYAPEEKRSVSPELVALNEPFSPRAEGFRAMRSQLMMRLFAEAEPRRALAVVSPDAGDGKTYCAANLAVTLAQLGGRTLLVDADMRGPRQHEVFKLKNKAGLSSILSGRSDSHVIQQVPGVSSLFVLPVGTTPPNPLELVERPAFGLLMRELASKFDHVIVDTPAAVYGADASVIAARCGAALIIARKDRSRVAMLQDLVASFEGSPAKLAGVIVNEY
jgi:chain length determinant protein tyrosine kinase EpsG